ncbi:MAG: UDP-N-acetylglucosamine--N-acetylmuramyl-(pentapeptide) pyrophosphoryl-undecaprenol N-acetylglucosamine transferase [Candidatus Moraniibacteriota bacterium]|nr:MAG: UDP-N-acetylglucosamine--N-acetylmuramyl-(pentapeptide) pyrophosphoryl-undecaprenol N-acetylglucosamine transferase [Candidatus Moranbacteria bacterium]
MSKYVFTGGHHNSALVVAQELKKLGHTIYWYGHRYSSRDDRHDSAEYLEVKNSGINFFDLPAGRAKFNLTELYHLPLGFLAALRLLRMHRPNAIITFGSYLGAATALAGFFLRIPIFLHEQTVSVGKANRLIGFFARRIYLTWDSSLANFKSTKSKVVGLPLRESILNGIKKKLFSRDKPTILVMGGKIGAHEINRFVFENITTLIKKYNIIHQTGTHSNTGDYEQAIIIKNNLGELAQYYQPQGYITENEIGSYLHSVDYYLGRSGAHICFELLFTHLRAILIPLPHAAGDEQLKNARLLEKYNLARIIPQTSLTLARFSSELTTLKQSKVTNFSPLPVATRTIIHELSNL